MRRAQVLYNKRLAGILSKEKGRYYFAYSNEYLNTSGSRPVSLTLPLREQRYESDILFPAFTNIMSEGANKSIQNRMLKIDETDYFSLLLATAGRDNIGPVTFKEINE